MRKLIGFVAIILVGLGACVQEPSFSSTPAISFKSIQKITKTSNDGFGGTTKIDSVIMSINFQDAEGDLGLTEAQLKSDIKYKDFRNFEVAVMLQKNGVFIPITFTPALGGLMNFNFKPNQKSGPIEGSIDYSTQFVYAFYKGYSPQFTAKNDTLKFKIFIRDNAFNKSNTIETDPIIIFKD
jgi:hypothetical protein